MQTAMIPWVPALAAQDTKLPDKLQAVVLPIIDFDICAAYYEAETDYSPVIESQLCAGFEEGRRDACQVGLAASLPSQAV